MVKRYVQLEEVLRHENMSPIHGIMLSIEEFVGLKSMIMPILDHLELANKKLQEDGLTLDVVRDLFDAIIETYGHLSPSLNFYLKASSTNHFENGVIALLRHEGLSQYQKVHMRRFLLQPESQPYSDDSLTATQKNILAIAAEKNKRRRVEDDSIPSYKKYMTMYHVVPTSNCCERLNSVGRHEKDYTRMKTSNRMFEVRMMLQANKSYWSALGVDKILTRENSVPDEELPDESSDGPAIEFDVGERPNECPEVSDEDFTLISVTYVNSNET
jgi:hypothetical protein